MRIWNIKYQLGPRACYLTPGPLIRLAVRMKRKEIRPRNSLPVAVNFASELIWVNFNPACLQTTKEKVILNDGVAQS